MTTHKNVGRYLVLLFSLFYISSALALVGELKGEFQVNATGSATYTIPIEVIPGVGDLTPSLAITYNHLSGDGLLGYGWSLSGLSTITRCSKVRSVDNFYQEIKYSETDAWCIDGQRLISKESTSAFEEYRTRINIYSRIRRYPDNHFVVETKSGLKMEFNELIHSNDSSLSQNPVIIAKVTKFSDTVGNSFNVFYTNTTINGGIENLVDYIEYNNRVGLPDQAKTKVLFGYENRVDTEIYGYLAGHKQVLSKRLKGVTNVQNNSIVSQYTFLYKNAASRTLLSVISQCGSNSTDCISTSLGWDEAIKDTPSFRPDNTAHINRFNLRPFNTYSCVDGVCTEITNDNVYQMFPRLIGDFDGDSVTDYAVLGNSNSGIHFGGNFGTPTIIYDDILRATDGWTKGHVRLIGDVTGDGKDDFVGIKIEASGNIASYVYKINSKTNNDSTVYITNLSGSGHGSSFDIGEKKRQFLSDVNGDGALDIVAVDGDWGKVVVALSANNGTGNFSSPKSWLQSSPTFYLNGNDDTFDFELPVSIGRLLRNGNFHLSDINGDGLPDLFGVTKGLDALVALSTGTSFEPFENWGSLNNNCAFGSFDDRGDFLPSQFGISSKLADVNGDSLPDWVIASASGAYVGLSTGRSFLDPAPNSIATTTDCLFTPPQDQDKWNRDIVSSQRSSFLADMNSDKKSDFIVYDSGGVKIYLSDGKKFELINNSNGYTFNEFGSNAASNASEEVWDQTKYPLSLGDYTGDGIIDFIGFNPQGLLVREGNSETAPRIKTIVTSLQNTIEIDYGKLTDSTLYDPGTINSTQPGLPIKNPLQVVKSYKSSNGLGGYNTYIYHYDDARIDRERHGVLGFRKITIKDVVLNKTTETVYKQDFPYIGQIESVTEKIGNTTVSHVIQTYIKKDNQFNGLYYYNIYTKTNTSKQYDPINGSLLSTTIEEQNDYADFGNPRKITKTIIDGTSNNKWWKTVNNNTYVENTDKWILSRLKTSNVSHSSYLIPAPVTKYSSFDYDAINGLLVEETIEPNNSNKSLYKKTNYQYDSYGHKSKVSISGYDYLGQTYSSRNTETAITFGTEDGKLVRQEQIINAEGHKETIFFSLQHGHPIKKIDVNSKATTWEYDVLGRKTKEHRPDNTETVITRFRYTCSSCPSSNPLYSAAYRIVTTATGASPVTVYYDMLGREIRTETIGYNGKKVFKDTQYNAKGLPVGISEPYFENDPKYSTIITYDGAGRVVKQIAPGNRSTSYGYNKFSITEINPLLQQVTRTSNAKGLLEKVEDGISFVTYTYDVLGTQQTAKTNNNSKTIITTVHDIRGRKISSRDPDMGYWVYRYNSFGEIEYQKDAKGNVVTITYDGLGRVTTRKEEDGGTKVAEVTRWVYDTASYGNGKLHYVVGPQKGYKKQYQYDVYGREVVVAESMLKNDGSANVLSATQTQSYDLFGRVQNRTTPLGVIRNHYDNQGHLSHITRISSPFAVVQNTFNAYQSVVSSYESAIQGKRSTISSEQHALETSLQTVGLYTTCDNNRYAIRAYEYKKKYACYQNEYEQAQDTLETFINEHLIYLPIITNRVTTIVPIYATEDEREYVRQQEIRVAESAKLAESYAKWEILEWDAFQLESAVSLLRMSTDLMGSGREVLSEVLWQVHNRDAEGRVTAFSTGNGAVTTERNYNAQTGYLREIISKKSNTGDIQDLHYQFDAIGNLTSRADGLVDKAEFFTYDKNRLESAYIHQLVGFNNDIPLKTSTVLNALSLSYNALGNITYKSDVGIYDYYHPTSSHAVTNAGDVSYSYDANGNMKTSGDGRSISWNSFNKPIVISQNGIISSQFYYGSDHQRIIKEDRIISGAEVDKTVTYYLGAGYKETIKQNGDQEKQQEISVPGATILFSEIVTANSHSNNVVNNNKIKGTTYALQDHLGSTDVVFGVSSSGNAVIQQRMSFNAFGERRDPVTWKTLNSSIPFVNDKHTDKGFTGHEQLDALNLVHMNGRVYDPRLGRFLSADPHIQSPDNTQSFNRYSYVLNNPLSLTDPSGYIFKWLVKQVNKVLTNGAFVRAIFGIAFAAIIGPTGMGLFGGGLTSAIAGGFVGAFVATGGDLKSAIIGGIAAGFMYHIGGPGLEFHEKVVAHGLVGGVSSNLNGGKFKAGFLAAAFGKISGGITSKFKSINAPLGTAAAAVVGGLTSKIAGGKFANGAMTAAFVHLFNDAAHNALDARRRFASEQGMLAHFKKMGWDGKTDIWWTMKGPMYGASATSPWADAINNEWAHEHIFFYDSATGTIGDFGFFSGGPMPMGYSPTDFFFGESINLHYGNPVQNLDLSGWQASSGTLQTISPSGSGPEYNLRNHNCQSFSEYLRGY